MEEIKKISLKLNIEEEDKTINEIKIEMVEFISKTKIFPYTKLIGRVVGDKNKIVFGTRRDMRSIIFQIYDFETSSTMDIMVVNKYAHWIFKQQFDLDENIIEYTDYGFTYPIKVKVKTENITPKENAVINEEIMDDFNSQTNKFRELMDDEILACENSYFMNSCEVMDTQYKSFCVPILTALMAQYQIMPNISNRKVKAFIKKLIIEGKQNNLNKDKYAKLMLKIPVNDMDELYDEVLLEVKGKLVFDDFEDPVSHFVDVLANDWEKDV